MKTIAVLLLASLAVLASGRGGLFIENKKKKAVGKNE